MNAAQQRILKYVTKNQPVTVAMIAQHAGVSRSHYYAESLQLRMKGILKSVTGIGVFAGEEAYKTWLDNGGRNQISENARNANAQRHPFLKNQMTTGVQFASHITGIATAWSKSTCAAHPENE